MAEITAADVKRLREKTGAGMMECKNALTAHDGDFEKAEESLKEKGQAALEKRADRETKEGKVFVKIKEDSSAAVLVEISSETDFVSRNDEFIALGEKIAEIALDKNYNEPNDELSGLVTELATKIREKMDLKRIKLVKAETNEYLCKYIHGDGKIGVVVKCSSDKPEIFTNEEIKTFVFSLALHVAAFNPYALEKNKIDPAYIKEQEDNFRNQIEMDEKLKGKPADLIEGIFNGKLKKHLSEICFLEQGYVKDEKLTVAQVLADCEKNAGAKLEITDFAYFKVGE